MFLWRHNSHTDIHGAPAWFFTNLRRHLSIPIAATVPLGERFGSKYFYQGEHYGSMIKGNRVTAGLTPHVWHIAKYYSDQGYHVPCEIKDCREKPQEQYPWFNIRAKWRPYQDNIHKTIMRESVGVVDAVPRSGKTLMAARAIDALALPTLYIAPSVAIVRQTYEVLCSYFGEDNVARLDGTAKPAEKDISKRVVVATAPSAIKQEKEFYDSRDLLIIDEFHHAAAETYHKINSLADKIYYRLCFTGTYWRTGGDRLALEAVCSRVLCRVTIHDLVPKYLVAPFVYYVPFRGELLKGKKDWREAYDAGIVECEERNILIRDIAIKLANENIPTIVLVKRRAHADLFGEMIPDSVVAKGGDGILTSRTIKKFLGGDFLTLVGTTVLGEGVDLPNAAALIYASGGSDSVQMMQAYFRPFTAYPGKEWGRVYDFQDGQHATLQRHSKERVACAKRYLGESVVHTPN